MRMNNVGDFVDNLWRVVKYNTSFTQYGIFDTELVLKEEGQVSVPDSLKNKLDIPLYKINGRIDDDGSLRIVSYIFPTTEHIKVYESISQDPYKGIMNEYPEHITKCCHALEANFKLHTISMFGDAAPEGYDPDKLYVTPYLCDEFYIEDTPDFYGNADDISEDEGDRYEFNANFVNMDLKDPSTESAFKQITSEICDHFYDAINNRVLMDIEGEFKATAPVGGEVKVEFQLSNAMEFGYCLIGGFATFNNDNPIVEPHLVYTDNKKMKKNVPLLVDGTFKKIFELLYKVSSGSTDVHIIIDKGSIGDDTTEENEKEMNNSNKGDGWNYV